MTDEEKIALIRLMIGDIPSGPYYPMFTDEEYMTFLKAAGGDYNKATVRAAISANYLIGSESSREVIGELQISNSSGANYLKLLDYLIKTVGRVPPAGLMPWFAGADGCGRNKLLDYSVCDVVNYDTFQNVWNKTGSGCCSSC